MQCLVLFCFDIKCHKRPTNADVCVILIFCFTDSKSQCFKRHSLNYLQEIGNGWFGKVTRSLLTFQYHCVFIENMTPSTQAFSLTACCALLYLILAADEIRTLNSKYFFLLLVSFSWALFHIIVHRSLLGDPG